MFTVVGSGFGLYGYVPALLHASEERVILPVAYRDVMERRADLSPYLPRVEWAADTDAALARADAVVLATVPSRQPQLVERCCAASHIDRIVLEKPVATTPAAAADVLARLDRSGKRYRIGYTLLHAAWQPGLEWNERSKARIEWTFMAHHFANDVQTWKRDPDQGGGVIRFFGVHVLALLAAHGYDRVGRSRLAAEGAQWHADFAGPGRPPAEVHVDSRAAQSSFRIRFGEGAPAIDLPEPFAQETPAAPDDRRVPVLQRLLASFDRDDERFRKLYADANRLWRQVEEATA